MSSTRRIGSQTSATRDAILESAVAVLQELGASGLTAGNVAKKAGIKPHMVHYYFRSIDDLVVEVVRQHGSLGLRNMARALTSDEPIRMMWECEMAFKWSVVALELTAVAYHKAEVKAELARSMTDIRSLQAEGIARYFELRGIESPLPPLVITVMIASIARQLVREQEFDVTLGHDEMIAMVEDFLQSLPRRAG